MPGFGGPLGQAQLPLQLAGNPLDQARVQVIRTLAPGACSAWAIRSAAVKSAGVDSSAITTTSLGPAIESIVHLAEDVPFGQGHEQIAGSDNLVDRPDAFDAVGQRRHPLCAADAINLADPQLVASRQQIAIVGAERRRRGDDRQLLHPRRLGRHDGHQHGRGISRRAAGNADAHPIQRHVPLDEPAAVGPLERDVAMQDRELEFQDPLANPPHRRQQFRIGLPVSRGQIGGRHAQRLGGKLGPIEPSGIVEHRVDAAR